MREGKAGSKGIERHACERNRLGRGRKLKRFNGPCDMTRGIRLVYFVKGGQSGTRQNAGKLGRNWLSKKARL